MKKLITITAILGATLIPNGNAQAFTGCSAWFSGQRQAGVYCQSGVGEYRARVACRQGASHHSYRYGPWRESGTWSSTAICPVGTFASSIYRQER